MTTIMPEAGHSGNQDWAYHLSIALPVPCGVLAVIGVLYRRYKDWGSASG